MKPFSQMAIKYENSKLLVLDQTQLPQKEVWLECTHPDQMFDFIQRLVVRGAPLIGVAAALSLAKFAEQGTSVSDIIIAAKKLKDARPTAVNLAAAMNQFLAIEDSLTLDKTISLAETILEQDILLCDKLATFGDKLIENGDRILTHCNAGALATAGVGTALGAIKRAHENGKNIHVFVDETRPLLQGARLTAWELKKLDIPFTVICDNMAASLMKNNIINKIFVGADRIARNGDVANKIGTYNLAVLAKHHNVPFYVVAPSTTLDLNCPSGDQIPIEIRAQSEILRDWTVEGAQAYNPSFDVTPKQFITQIILDSEDSNYSI